MKTSNRMAAATLGVDGAVPEPRQLGIQRLEHGGNEEMRPYSVMLASLLLGVAADAPMWPARADTFLSSPGGLATPGDPVAASLKAKVTERFGRLPLAFEANQGQSDDRVKFLSRGRGYSLLLTPAEAVLLLEQARPDESRASSWPMSRRASRSEATDKADPVALRMRLVGSNPAPQMTGLDELPGKVNYFIGNDPARWRTNVPRYAKVKYHAVYHGVDLVYYGHQDRLEYDLVIAPGVDPRVIRLAFEGSIGLEEDADGDLIIRTSAGEIRQKKPLVFQEIDGVKIMIPGRYVLMGSHVGIQVARYDRRRALVVDPQLVYSTYIGGSDQDNALGIAVDSTGHAYITGGSTSLDFPLRPPHAVLGVASRPAFVTKLNPDGSDLVYSTFIGGSVADDGSGIAVDRTGSAYITGFTISPDFPTTPGAFQTSLVPGSDSTFVLKLNPQGSALIYSTYLGGSHVTKPGGIAVDSSGNIYVMGLTGYYPPATTNDFPTTAGAFQTTSAGGSAAGQDYYVVKLDPSKSGSAALRYSTYLGGRDDELLFSFGNCIAVDSAGNIYVCGFTRSTDFPTTPGAFQRTLRAPQGSYNAVVAKIDPSRNGSASLVYSTYLGASVLEIATAIAVDASGHAYVAGASNSPDFPTVGTIQPHLFGGTFVTKLSPDASTLVYSSLVGGSDGRDSPTALGVDQLGNAYVAGYTYSMDFPTTSGAFQTTIHSPDGSYDGYILKLDPSGSVLLYSTYLGGSDLENLTGIAVDASRNVYVSGYTPSGETGVVDHFPTTMGAFRTTPPGGLSDAFVARLSIPDGIVPLQFVTFPPALPSLPSEGTTGVPYIGNIGIGGDAPPYTVTVVGGALPSGLSFGSAHAATAASLEVAAPAVTSSDSPVITGTPTQCGTSEFMVDVFGRSGQAISGIFPIRVTDQSGHTQTITQSPGGSPNPVASGAPTHLSATVVDSQGNPLSYAWTASCLTLASSGTFDNPNTRTPTWTAPTNTTGAEHVCTLGLMATAGDCLSRSSFVQRVASVDHTLTITAGPTGAPNPAPSAGTADLSVTAVDSLSNTLSYAWVASCPSLAAAGTFSSSTAQNPTWTAPVNTTGTQQTCTLQVTVSDGQDLTQVGTFSLGVASIAHTLIITAGPSGTPNPVPSGGTSSLSVTAADSLGHALSYAWTVSCPSLPSLGSFSSATTQNPTWIAPANTTGVQQDCTLQVTVSDGQGLTQVPTFSLGVASIAHTLTITAGPSGTPNPVPSEGTTSLSVTALDSLGHSLTYAWTASCPSPLSSGTFSDAAAATQTWTAPMNMTGILQTCMLQVTVSDGQGLVQIGSLSQGVFTVGHSLTITDGPTGAPNPVPSEGTVTLNVTAIDSLGHPLTYTWQASCPSLPSAGGFSSTTAQHPTWIAPRNATGVPQTCTLQVAVSDDQGLAQVGTLDEGVASIAHTLTITAGPTGTPDAVPSEGTASLHVTAVDSLDHDLSYAWVAACPSLPSAGHFSNSATQNPSWTAPANTTGDLQTCALQVGVSDGHGLTQVAMVNLDVNGPTTLQPLAAAVLPASRSVQVGTPATAFVTIINAGSASVTSAAIALATSIPATFAFQTTDPLTNRLTGTANSPVDIPAGSFQSFVVGITPTAAFPPTHIAFTFAGSNAAPVTPLTGINTLLLSGSLDAVPDIVALAATIDNTGIVKVPGVQETGAFGVATVNVGASASITVSADTGNGTPPVTVTLCQTDPLTSACTSSLGPSLTTQINANDTPTFAIFVTAQDLVPFDPGRNRVFVRFRDAAGIERGATSVAVRSP
jgi:hypothetical protein